MHDWTSEEQSAEILKLNEIINIFVQDTPIYPLKRLKPLVWMIASSIPILLLEGKASD